MPTGSELTDRHEFESPEIAPPRRPLKYADFLRTFIGPEFDFDVQPVLLGSEVPWCQLSPHDSQGARLGWNTWVRAQPFTSTVKDAIFSLADV